MVGVGVPEETLGPEHTVAEFEETNREKEITNNNYKLKTLGLTFNHAGKEESMVRTTTRKSNECREGGATLLQ